MKDKIKLNCKVCQHEFNFCAVEYCNLHCKYCKNYSFMFQYGEIETENIIYENFSLIFLPRYKEASIITTHPFDGKRCYRSIKIIPLNELTHEQAVQWVNKLKNYVLFQ